MRGERHLRNALVIALLAGLAAVIMITAASSPPAETRSDQPPKLTILYIADPSKIPAASYRSPDLLSSRLNFTSITLADQQDKRLLEADVIIVDQSAESFVDREQIQLAYLRGAVIAGLNIPIKEFAALINDPCVSRDGFAADPYPGDYFILAAVEFSGASLLDVQRVREGYRANCGSAIVPGVTGSVSGGSKGATSSLDTGADADIFALVVSDDSKLRLQNAGSAE